VVTWPAVTVPLMEVFANSAFPFPLIIQPVEPVTKLFDWITELTPSSFIVWAPIVPAFILSAVNSRISADAIKVAWDAIKLVQAP
jgi:hypothetical protein